MGISITQVWNVYPKKDWVIGMPKLESVKVACEGCLAGKKHREKFPHESKNRAEKVL
jgi:hypothetical protein